MNREKPIVSVLFVILIWILCCGFTEHSPISGTTRNPTYDSATVTGAVTAGSVVVGTTYLQGIPGAVGNGTADDTAAIAAMDVALGVNYAVIDLLGKSYVADTWVMASNRTIKNGTIIFKSAETGYLLDLSSASNIVLENVNLIGNATALSFVTGTAQGNRSAILATNVTNVRIVGGSISDFSNYGVDYANSGSTGTVYGNGLTVIDTRLLRNWCNYFAEAGGEYARLSGVSLLNGRYGVYDVGGNLLANGCDINGNVDNVYLATGSNDTHSIFNACNINHPSDSGHCIYANGILRGTTFSGCHAYAGIIDIINSSGVEIVNGQLGSVILRVGGGGYNRVSDNMVDGGYLTVTRNYGSTDYSSVENNRDIWTGSDAPTNLLTSWANSAHADWPYETFTTSGPSITSAINTTLYGVCNSNSITTVVGKVYELRVYFVKNSGSAPALRVNGAVDLAGGTSMSRQLSGDGLYTIRFTALTTTSYISLNNGSGEAANYAVRWADLRETAITDTNGITVRATSGSINIKRSEESAAITADTSITIPVTVPSGAILLYCVLRVDTALTAGETWDAAYSGGATTSITSGQAVAKNTKVPVPYNANGATAITSGVTNIAVTKNGGGSFTAAGVIRAVVYYIDATAMDDAE